MGHFYYTIHKFIKIVNTYMVYIAMINIHLSKNRLIKIFLLI